MNPQVIVAEALDHARGMWRYRWLTAAVSWSAGLLGSLFVFSLPPIYSASAEVFVDTNSLIEPLMRGLTATQDRRDGVELVGRALLARPNLEVVARQTLLVGADDSAERVEAIVTRLQRRVQVRSGRRNNVVAISYQDVNREKAREVVEAVLDTFVEGTLGIRDDDAEVTERALRSEIEQHEVRLRDSEAALAEFRKNNVGYMPDEYGDYAGRLQAALAQERVTGDQVRLMTERRDALRRQLEGEQVVADVGPAVCSHSAQLSDLTVQLSALAVEYTDKHPRIVALQDRVAFFQERCAEELDVARRGVAPRYAGAPLEESPIYQDLRIQLNNAEVQLAELNAVLRTQQEAVARLRRDVDKIAEVETRLKQLNRDYQVVQHRHQELLGRWEDLQAKMRLDPVTEAVQFRRIQPPYALPNPVGPNRVLLLGAVLALSLAAGGGAAFALNQLGPVFFSRRKLAQAAGLPVLGSVSLLMTSRAAALRALDRVAIAGAFCLLLAFAAAAVSFAEPLSELLRAFV